MLASAKSSWALERCLGVCGSPEMLPTEMDHLVPPCPVGFGIWRVWPVSVHFNLSWVTAAHSLAGEVRRCLPPAMLTGWRGLREYHSGGRLPQSTARLSPAQSSPLGWGGVEVLLGCSLQVLTLCFPAGHGHGHDDRVLPLHIHHSGNVPPGPGVGRGGAPGGPGWSCLARAVGVAPREGTKVSQCPAWRSDITCDEGGHGL